nr:transcription factor TGA2.2 [Ipomoea batatas]
MNIVGSDGSDKTRDQKTLRRLAQNREAARKSRLRKKAYVQQLENSRMKLTQLEQELQRARQQVCSIHLNFNCIFIFIFNLLQVGSLLAFLSGQQAVFITIQHF